MSAPAVKRLFDICCAGIGLPVLLPLGLLIGLLIKLSDGGPVFFGQVRVGRSGTRFRIWKFRSMVVDADKMGVQVTKRRDPRITRIGRFLRNTKLDELPQLWNVMVGEMTFVGPRPEVPKYVERYTPEQRDILRYKPGITDLASLLFRNEEALLSGAGDVEEFYLRYCLPKKIELNQRYAQSAGLAQDVWIILQTLCPYWLGVLAIYGIVLAVSFWCSFELRADFRMTDRDYAQFSRGLPWMVGPQLVLLLWDGQLRGLISYFSIPELRHTASSLLCAMLLQGGLCYLFLGSGSPSRGLFLLDLIISLFFLSGVRTGFRMLRERSSDSKGERCDTPRRVVIVGTGSLGINLALDIARDTRSARRVVAFFDDDPRTWHKRPHDIPVFGMPECLLHSEWVKKIDEIIVALPAGNPARLTEVVEMLRGLSVKVTVISGWPAV